MLVLEAFAGAGGASLGIHCACPDATVIGIEWDRAACATRAAAGLATIRADVQTFPLDHLAGLVWGCWLSPPCPSFSSAGSGAGHLLIDLLADGMRRTMAGEECRAEVEEACYLRLLDGPKPEKAEAHAAMSVLVLESARWARALRPEWIACEQVPAVLPLWQVLAHELRQMGYAAWVGILDAADYGVPQNRTRAILMARAGVRTVQPPESTHTDQRRSPSLFLEPHVSMADALGWGMTERAALTVATGHLDPSGVGGSGARRTLHGERGGGRWLRREAAADAGRMPSPATDPAEPSPANPTHGDGVELDRRTNSKAAGGGHGPDRPRPDRPASPDSDLQGGEPMGAADEPAHQR